MNNNIDFLEEIVGATYDGKFFSDGKADAYAVFAKNTITILCVDNEYLKNYFFKDLVISNVVVLFSHDLIMVDVIDASNFELRWQFSILLKDCVYE